METILSRWRTPELVRNEIDRLEKELEESREVPESDFLGLSESTVVIALGILGVLGSGQAAAWLLQSTMGPGMIQGPDFVQASLQAAQAGLLKIGTWGPSAASLLGWLILLGLTAFHLLFQGPRREGTKPSPLWLGWLVALSLIAVPFYDFTEKRPKVSILLGIAISSGLFALSPLFQRSEPLRRFLGRLDHDGVGAALAAILLLLIVTGFLFPVPTAALCGVFVASGLSSRVVLLGLHRRAKTKAVIEASSRLDSLRDELSLLERRQWIEEQLRRFREGSPPPRGGSGGGHTKEGS
jgi:hypothetical protein